MSPARANFVANLAGAACFAIVSLVCTPLYIRFLGAEGYGLVGFYLLVQTLAGVLDLGLTATINREMARYSATPELVADARDLARTIEVGYWGIALLIGAVFELLTPGVATRWIQVGSLSPEDVRHVIAAMGVLLALQWPLSVYQGGLLGLQRHVLLNSINGAGALLSGFGAVAVLRFLAPEPRAFFVWQVVVVALQVVATRTAFWRSLPSSGRRARVDARLIRKIGRFAAGMSGITLTALVLTQVDKVVLSRVLPMHDFGLYSLATLVGTTGLTQLVIAPMFNTLYPRFSREALSGGAAPLRQTYHASTQALAVLLFPAAAVVSLFGNALLQLWTRDADVARSAGPIAAVLVIGTALNGMSNPPFALQLANGWTRLCLTSNIVAIAFMAPATVVLAERRGALGVAFAWLALNVFLLAVVVPITDRRFDCGGVRRWFLVGLALPASGAFAVAILARVALGDLTQVAPLGAFCALAAITVLGYAAAALVTPEPRRWLRSVIAPRLGLAVEPVRPS